MDIIFNTALLLFVMDRPFSAIIILILSGRISIPLPRLLK